MERDELKILLAKYEKGETSLKEEYRLKSYFDTQPISEDLEKYRVLFAFTVKERAHSLPKMPEIPNKKRKFAFSSIAAILIVAVGIFYFNKNATIANKNLGTIHDKEQALEKSKETLNLVSQYLNDGSNNFVYLKEFNKTQKKIIQID